MNIHQAHRIEISFVLESDTPVHASDLLSARTGISKMKIKDAMNKGAVYIKKNGKLQRLRKATALLHKGAAIEMHYDERLLSHTPPEPKLIADNKHYTVWFKPAGLMSQGTAFGDHCSLLRKAEMFFSMQRKVFLVHRLDMEAEGIMLIAHTKEAAAKLSVLFQKKLITKEYHVEVLGALGEPGSKGSINLPLDGKEALTDYKVLAVDHTKNSSTACVNIQTGRLHQIRRHLDMIGHPVMGDPKYGKGNKNREGMRLAAVSLNFRCPFSNQDVEFRIKI